MLQCPVAGFPRLTTTWQHLGNQISSRHKQFPNGTLLLRNVDVQNDEGVYSCKVQSQQSKSATSRINLKIMSEYFQEVSFHSSTPISVF